MDLEGYKALEELTRTWLLAARSDDTIIKALVYRGLTSVQAAAMLKRIRKGLTPKEAGCSVHSSTGDSNTSTRGAPAPTVVERPLPSQPKQRPSPRHLDQAGHNSIWIPETAGITGGVTRAWTPSAEMDIPIPPGTEDGDILRIEGAGIRPRFWSRKREPYEVKVRLYSPEVLPSYEFLDPMDFAGAELQEWVDNRLRLIERRLNRKALGRCAERAAERIADQFNLGGWPAAVKFVIQFFGQEARGVGVVPAPIPSPGQCRVTTREANGRRWKTYEVLVSNRFLHNPFFVAAIVAHELCHVVYREKIDPEAGFSPTTLAEERTVDLLVFFHGLGEFQLRVARQCGVTLGYFDQHHFERLFRLLND